MPPKTANVRNNLQKYIIQIGDAVSKDESLQKYENLLESLNILAETTEEYYWKNEGGKQPVLKEEDIKKIKGVYETAVKHCNRMLTVPMEEIKGIHTLVNELSNLLSRDEAALDVMTAEKEMTLTEVLEHGRARTVDIGEQEISTVGNQMSSRIPLQMEVGEGIIKRGFFTKSTVADPLVNRDILTQELRKKYPQLEEIFDYIDKCDRETVGLMPLSSAPRLILLQLKSDEIEHNSEQAKNIAYEAWQTSLSTLNVPKAIIEKHQFHPQYPKMMMELNAEFNKIQAQYLMYHEDKTAIHTDVEANIDKRNVAMSCVSALIGKPKLLTKSEPMILMQNGKAVSGTFMENAVGKDAYHLPKEDPMHEYGEEVYDNPEVFADIAALQALDYICGNIDRHEGNMFYQFGEVNGKQKLIGIVGIDNDMSFGMTPPTTNRNIGNMWVQPEQFGVLDAKTAEHILAMDKSILKVTLAGYGLSEKEINAAWERTAHLQERILEGMKYFENKKPGLVEAGHVRIVPSDEWQFYNRKTLAKVGKNQYAVLGNMSNLIKKQEKAAENKDTAAKLDKETIKQVFQLEKDVVHKEKTPVPVGRSLGHGVMLKEEMKNALEPVKLVVPKDAKLDYTSGYSNKRFTMAYEDEKGNLKECFFTQANTLAFHELMDTFIDALIGENPECEEHIDRLRAHYHRIDREIYAEDNEYRPSLEELGYGEVEIELEKISENKKFEKMTNQVAVFMYSLNNSMEDYLYEEYRTESGRVDLRNVAMNQLGDKLGVGNLLARAVPVQVQFGDRIVDGITMERAQGIDVRNVRQGDPITHIESNVFDGAGLKSVSNVQILDYISNNIDRHFENMIYQFEGLDTDNPKFVGIQGIDHDLAFMGVCPRPDQRISQHAVVLDEIEVISEEMAQRVMGMEAEDISNTLSFALNKKEIIATQGRLARLQEAIESGKIRIVKNEEWKDMKLDDLSQNHTIFSQIKIAFEKIKEPSKKPLKKISFEKVERVKQFDSQAVENKNIDDKMETVKVDFEKEMLDVAKSEQPINEMDEKAVFQASKENINHLSKMLDQADPFFVRSSEEYKAMKSQCQQTANRIRLIEQEMIRNKENTPSAEQSQLLFENMVALKRTASMYEMYKSEALGERSANKREQARINVAQKTASVAESLCEGFRANAKVRWLQLHTYRTLNSEIKSVLNDMKSPAYEKEDYKKAFAKILYIKTITENSDKFKQANVLASALNPKAVEKAVNVITKKESFENFMNTPKEKLLNMLETKSGLPFYKHFLRENAAVMVKEKEEAKNIQRASKEQQVSKEHAKIGKSENDKKQPSQTGVENSNEGKDLEDSFCM